MGPYITIETSTKIERRPGIAPAVVTFFWVLEDGDEIRPFRDSGSAERFARNHAQSVGGIVVWGSAPDGIQVSFTPTP